MKIFIDIWNLRFLNRNLRELKAICKNIDLTTHKILALYDKRAARL
jgi:hypothetical protein